MPLKLESIHHDPTITARRLPLSLPLPHHRQLENQAKLTLSSHLSCQISSQISPQNYSPWNTNVSLLSSGIRHSTWSLLQNSKPWPSWDSQHGPGPELLVSALISTWPMPMPSKLLLIAVCYVTAFVLYLKANRYSITVTLHMPLLWAWHVTHSTPVTYSMERHARPCRGRRDKWSTEVTILLSHLWCQWSMEVTWWFGWEV